MRWLEIRLNGVYRDKLMGLTPQSLVMWFYNIAIPIVINTAKKINNLPKFAFPLCSSLYRNFNFTTS